MRKRKWLESQFKEAVAKSRSVRQVLSRLGLKEAGGNYAQIKKYISEFDLDVVHFKGRGWNKGLHMPFRAKVSLNNILVKNSSFQSFKLKKRLFAAGIKPKYCENCGWAQKTPDGYLPLEIDHINGDPRDNRLENLRILCPNCHSLTPHHRGRNCRKIKSDI
jgi:hypothetical protein